MSVKISIKINIINKIDELVHCKINRWSFSCRPQVQPWEPWVGVSSWHDWHLRGCGHDSCCTAVQMLLKVILEWGGGGGGSKVINWDTPFPISLVSDPASVITLFLTLIIMNCRPLPIVLIIGMCPFIFNGVRFRWIQQNMKNWQKHSNTPILYKHRQTHILINHIA